MDVFLQRFVCILLLSLCLITSLALSSVESKSTEMLKKSSFFVNLQLCSLLLVIWNLNLKTLFFLRNRFIV